MRLSGFFGKASILIGVISIVWMGCSKSNKLGISRDVVDKFTAGDFENRVIYGNDTTIAEIQVYSGTVLVKTDKPQWNSDGSLTMTSYYPPINQIGESRTFYFDANRQYKKIRVVIIASSVQTVYTFRLDTQNRLQGWTVDNILSSTFLNNLEYDSVIWKNSGFGIQRNVPGSPPYPTILDGTLDFARTSPVRNLQAEIKASLFFGILPTPMFMMREQITLLTDPTIGNIRIRDITYDAKNHVTYFNRSTDTSVNAYRFTWKTISF